MINKFHSNPSQKNIDNAILELQNNKNNAVAHVYNNAKVINEGVLSGVPITIKNHFTTKDAPTDGSSKLLEGFLPGYDAHIVKLLKNNGASIVAKVNLDELALGGTGLYSSHGIITNPLDNTRMVGGSSSGSAATFTNKIGASIGSDTGDSVRLPSSYIGCVGYKPSYGAISRRGMFAYASSLDTVGYFTHNTYDAAIISSALFGLDKHDATSRKVDLNVKNIKNKKPKKVSYLFLEEHYEKYVTDSFKKLIHKLKQDNVEVELIQVDKNILKALPIVYKIISFSEAASNNSNLSGLLFGNTIEKGNWSDTMIATRTSGFGKIATARMILGSLFLQKDNQILFLEKAQKVRTIICNIFRKILNNTDVLIFPTSNDVAPLINEKAYHISSITSNDNFAGSLLLFANLLGSPSISIPLGKKQKLPYGLNINSKIYNDEELLSFSMYFETLLGDANE